MCLQKKKRPTSKLLKQRGGKISLALLRPNAKNKHRNILTTYEENFEIVQTKNKQNTQKLQRMLVKLYLRCNTAIIYHQWFVRDLLRQLYRGTFAKKVLKLVVRDNFGWHHKRSVSDALPRQSLIFQQEILLRLIRPEHRKFGAKISTLSNMKIIPPPAQILIILL